MARRYLIHLELTRRLRDTVPVGALGLYIMGLDYCAEHKTNGVIPLREVRAMLGNTVAERQAAVQYMTALCSNGFWDPGDPTVLNVTVSDWGEWVVLEGEAGVGEGWT